MIRVNLLSYLRRSVQNMTKQQSRKKRHRRIRARIFGTAKLPRFFVFRSSRHIYAQLIDDDKGHILASANDLFLKKITEQLSRKSPQKERFGDKIAAANEVGKAIADGAIKKGIKKAVFDRGGYKYHGRIKAVAGGARKGGLKF